MAKYFKQFRYFDDNNSSNANRLNEPKNLCQHHLYTGSAFSGNSIELTKNYLPITKLGIYSLPGTKFYLNDEGLTSPIVIGMTGTFELDLKDNIHIDSLRFDNESLNLIRSNNNAYLIIDIIYEEGED